MNEQSVCGQPDMSARKSRPDCKCKLAIFALPGMGKTTFSQRFNEDWAKKLGWIVEDVDFGSWRKRQGVDRLWRSGVDESVKNELYSKFVKCEINPILDEVDVILCNEPGLAALLPIEVSIVTVVPDKEMEELWLKNLVYRTVKNYKESADEPSFLELIASEGKEWPKSPAWRLPGSMQLKFRTYDDWGIVLALMDLLI